MQDIAKQRGGLCLSTEYVNANTYMRWRCEKGHEWEAIGGSVWRGSWCLICAGQQRLTIEHAYKLAASKHGKCLSAIYENVDAKLKWQCKDGHVWSASYYHVRSGTWCPKCSENIGERISRWYFEQILQKKFPKARPVWLRLGGSNLELDGFCEELNLAFEYQGVQHYKHVHFFHNTKEDYDEIKKRDARKRDLCKKRGVVLIEIPYTLQPKDVGKFIINACVMHGIDVPVDQKLPEYDEQNVYSEGKLDKLRKIAQERSGDCISPVFLGVGVKHRWKCGHGHIWEAVPSSIKSGRWCPKCSGRARLTIEEMCEVARQRGGECLSQEYVDNKTHLKWECDKGHTWMASPSNIKRGKWCPKCARIRIEAATRHTLEDMHILAAKYNGKCLSKEYKGSKTPLVWECEMGHAWAARPEYVSQGTWCALCAQNKKK